MQRISISLLDLVVCFATAMQAQTQAPNPDPELKKLEIVQPPFDPPSADAETGWSYLFSHHWTPLLQRWRWRLHGPAPTTATLWFINSLPRASVSFFTLFPS
jgi:hypothetical protein